MSFKKIMVAVDYSSCSKVAYQYAVVLAGEFGARLDVVHAWDRPHYSEDDDLVVARSGEGKLTLGQVLKETAEEDMQIFLAGVEVPENVDLNQEELAQSINLGYAFCAQHKNGRRKSANFTEAGFLAVDIDEGKNRNRLLRTYRILVHRGTHE